MKCTACHKPIEAKRWIPWTQCPAEKLCYDCRTHVATQGAFERLVAQYGIDPHHVCPELKSATPEKPKPSVEHIVVRGEDIWPSWFPVKDNRLRKR